MQARPDFVRALDRAVVVCRRQLVCRWDQLMRFFNNIRVTVKLPIIMVALSLFALVATTAMGYRQARNTLSEQAAIALERQAVSQAAEISEVFDSIQQSLGIQVENPFVHDALDRFREGWDQMPGDATALLREAYIERNPNETPDRAAFDRARDGSQYSRYHSTFHPYFRATRDAHQLADIYLIDARGNLVYSVSKLDDFAIAADKLPSTGGISQVIALRTHDRQNQTAAFVDFAPQSNLGEQESAFLANSVFDRNQRFLGHVVYRLTTDRFELLLQSSEDAMKQVLVRAGSDVLASSFTADGTSLVIPAPLQELSTLARPGMVEDLGLDGQMSFIGYAQVQGVQAPWAVLSQKSHDDQLIAARQLLDTFVLNALGLLLFVSAIGVFLARSISTPLVAVGSSIADIAERRLASEIPGLDRQDEIGGIANALKALHKDLSRSDTLEAENRFKSAGFICSSAAMMIVDADYLVTFINPELQALLNENIKPIRLVYPQFKPDMVIGQSIFRFQPKGSLFEKQLKESTDQRVSCILELGDSVLNLKAAVVLDVEQEKLGYIIEWSDISNELTKSAVFQAIDSGQCRFEIDLSGQIGSLNRNARDALAILGDEPAGLIFKDLWPEQSTSKMDGIWEDLIGGEVYSGKVELLDISGDSVWLQTTISPVLSDDGTPRKFVCLATDISDDEKAAQENQEVLSSKAEKQGYVVSQLSAGLKRLSDGDLSFHLDHPFEQSYEPLRKDFNSTVFQLSETLRSVLENSEAIKNEAHQISAAADDLSKRTESQAGALEETAGAIEELTVSVSAAAEGAKLADALASEAQTSSNNSSEIVEHAVSAMAEIEQSSVKISSIIDVIDDIAFQTNLLALNAGVEAARAGDAGRGFAVVASEVRALAQRSSGAAREIGELISSSGQHVKKGVGLVGDVGNALDQIIHSIGNIANQVSGISESAQQQSQNLLEINTSVNELDHVTQQNAAMFEETTATAHALTQEAENLTALVAQFQVSQRDAEDHQPQVMEELSEEVLVPVVRPAETVSIAKLEKAGSYSNLQKIEDPGNDWSEF